MQFPLNTPDTPAYFQSHIYIRVMYIQGGEDELESSKNPSPFKSHSYLVMVLLFGAVDADPLNWTGEPFTPISEPVIFAIGDVLRQRPRELFLISIIVPSTAAEKFCSSFLRSLSTLIMSKNRLDNDSFFAIKYTYQRIPYLSYLRFIKTQILKFPYFSSVES